MGGHWQADLVVKQRRPLLVEGRGNSGGRLMPVVDQVNLLHVVWGLSCEYACFFFCSGLCLPSASWAAALPVQLKCGSGGPLRLSPFFCAWSASLVQFRWRQQRAVSSLSGCFRALCHR